MDNIDGIPQQVPPIEEVQETSKLNIDTTEAPTRGRLTFGDNKYFDRLEEIRNRTDLKSEEPYEHNTELGQIEWDKEKYKNYPYHVFPSPETAQKFPNGATGREMIETLKKEGIKPLNSNVLSFLLKNLDQIPDEWKDKYVYFWGTTYSSGGWPEIDCLYYNKGLDMWSVDWFDPDQEMNFSGGPNRVLG